MFLDNGLTVCSVARVAAEIYFDDFASQGLFPWWYVELVTFVQQTCFLV